MPNPFKKAREVINSAADDAKREVEEEKRQEREAKERDAKREEEENG